MKEDLTKWFDEENREYEDMEHDKLNWFIKLKHGERVILIGNPIEYPMRLELVYKLSVSPEHKGIIRQLNPNQRGGFEKALVLLLATDNIIYNIRRDEDNLPDSIIVKKHLYEEDLTRTELFDGIQTIINVGLRATIHFQSLGGAPVQDKELSSTGPSLYR